jgi:hypothetical protein
MDGSSFRCCELFNMIKYCSVEMDMEYEYSSQTLRVTYLFGGEGEDSFSKG